MAKSKKPMQVVIGGIAYYCSREDGKIKVRIARTARGQNLIAGVYDLSTKTWHNDNSNAPLPQKAKDYILTLMT